MSRAILTLLLLLLSLFANAEERSLRIVELRYSLATPVLEVLRPHLPAGAGASAVDNKLLLNLTENEWAQVQNVIGQLDKPPVRLLVSVQWQQQQLGSDTAVAANVELDHDGARIGAAGQYQTQRDNDSNLQQVHTLSGQTSFIHTGTEIPELTIHLSTRGELITSNHYRESGRGFYVLPVVQGDQVLVRINPRERVPVTAEDGSLHINVLETQVQGPLGQWLPLAAVQRTGDSTWQTRRADWRVQIKIDKLP